MMMWWGEKGQKKKKNLSFFSFVVAVSSSLMTCMTWRKIVREEKGKRYTIHECLIGFCHEKLNKSIEQKYGQMYRIQKKVSNMIIRRTFEERKIKNHDLLFFLISTQTTKYSCYLFISLRIHMSTPLTQTIIIITLDRTLDILILHW